MLTATRTAALAAAAAVLASGLSGCAASRASEAGHGLRIVTTVAPITSIVANIGGARVQITGLVPEGTNSHTFEPRPSDARAIGAADVIFANGLQLEEPLRRLAERTKRPGTPIVELGGRVLPPAGYIFDFSFPVKDGKPNPHLWTDPLYAIRYAGVIRDELVRLDEANRSYYDANLAAFRAKASALDRALRTAQRTVPGGRLELLTYHDAYAYFARDYGWRVIGAVQPKDFEDPTAREVAALIDQVRRARVRTIFGSEVFPSKVLAQIGRETGARYEDTLRDDDLPGRPGDREHSWFGLMRYDFRTMVAGLGGDPAALDALDVADVAPDRARYPQ